MRLYHRILPVIPGKVQDSKTPHTVVTLQVPPHGGIYEQYSPSIQSKFQSTKVQVCGILYFVFCIGLQHVRGLVECSGGE